MLHHPRSIRVDRIFFCGGDGIFGERVVCGETTVVLLGFEKYAAQKVGAAMVDFAAGESVGATGSCVLAVGRRDGGFQLSNDFVDGAELFFQFAEFVLEVEQDAVVEVLEFTVDGFHGRIGVGELDGELFVADYSSLSEVGGVGGLGSVGVR